MTVRPENCSQDLAEACTLLGPPPTIYYPDVEYLFRGQGKDAEREAVYLNFLHELGHVYDFTQPRHPYRVRFLRIMRLPLVGSAAELKRRMRPAGWMQTGLAQPDELFAMAYSYCAAALDFPTVKAIIHGVYWGYGYNPTRRQYDATCSLLRGRSRLSGLPSTLGRANPPSPSGASTPASPERPLQPPPGGPPGVRLHIHLPQPPPINLPQPPPIDDPLLLPPLGGVPQPPFGGLPPPPPLGKAPIVVALRGSPGT